MLTLADVKFTADNLHLTYRCVTCGEAWVLTSNRFQAIADHVYEERTRGVSLDDSRFARLDPARRTG